MSVYLYVCIFMYGFYDNGFVWLGVAVGKLPGILFFHCMVVCLVFVSICMVEMGM